MTIPPSTHAARLKAAPAAHVNFHGCRILLVDDEVAIRTALDKLLTALNGVVELAQSADEALDRFRASPNFDLILLDISMPEKSGVQALRELRTEFESEVPVVLMTGFTDQPPMESLAGLRSVGVIHKPFTAARLSEAFREIINSAAKDN